MAFAVSESSSVFPAFSSILALASNGPVVVGVGQDSVSYVSTDAGGTFTQYAGIAYGNWSAIAAGNGRFVTVDSGSGTAAWSADNGATFNSVTIASGAMNAIVFGLSKFVACNNSTIVYSTDGGETWIEVTPPEYLDLSAESLTFTGSGFLVLDRNGNAAYTTGDGETWISTPTPTLGQRLSAVAVVSGMIIGLARATALAFTSADGGATWSSVTLPRSGYWTNLVYNGTRLFGVSGGESANSYVTSLDAGATWSLGSFTATSYWQALAASGTTIVVASSSAVRALGTGDTAGVVMTLDLPLRIMVGALLTVDLPIDVFVYQSLTLDVPLRIMVFEPVNLDLPLSVSVVSPLVFSAGEHSIKWYPTITVGGVDISSRQTGLIRISGAEQAARVADFSVIPLNAAEYQSFKSAAVTIDVTLFRTNQVATYRRFTGVVERAELNAAGQVAKLICRDGYQERPKACASAAAVEALLGGRAYPNQMLLKWSDDTPDATGYFSGLMDTMIGSVAIDSAGLWRAFGWDIGMPQATFTLADVFDDSVSLVEADRANLPKTVDISFVHRHHRLHNLELDMSWSALGFERNVQDLIPNLTKSTIQAAIDGLSDWFVKGEVTITEPSPGTHFVNIGGQAIPYVIAYDAAPLIAQTMAARMYRRWYQQVQVTYALSIDVGGSSDRSAIVSGAVESDFDAGAWETVKSTTPTASLYSANAPVVATPPTGYEGLSAPWPPANGALDHYGSTTVDDLMAAMRHVMAKGLRQAAAGRRDQRLKFAKPFDPRWEIGDVLAGDFGRIGGVGQLIDFDDTLDRDSGEIVSALTLAVPDGVGATTGFVATIAPPVNTVSYAPAPLVLGNQVGAALETPSVPDEDTLTGFLCNVVATGANYDASKPVYNQQFRIILPEIPAEYRDPLEITVPITATVNLASGALTINF